MQRIVIWDIDGTLLDTKPGIWKAVNHTLERLNYPTIGFNDISRYIGPPIRDSFIKFHNMDSQKADIATCIYRSAYIQNFILSYNYFPLLDVNYLLNLKQNGFILCVATMKTSAQVNKLLFDAGFLNLFDMIECVSETTPKSKSEMISTIIAHYGKQDALYYMIGDTEGDFEASSSNSICFIHAKYGYGQVKNCDYSIDSVTDLYDVLNIVNKNF